MAKVTYFACDRCGCTLTATNWQAHDELCDDCVLLAEGAAVVGKQAILHNAKPREYLKRWLELYEDG